MCALLTPAHFYLFIDRVYGTVLVECHHAGVVVSLSQSLFRERVRILGKPGVPLTSSTSSTSTSNIHHDHNIICL